VSDARLSEAQALHGAGKLAEAAKAYNQILQSNPKHFDALLLLGVLHLQSGQFEDAERVLGAAVALDPNSLNALSMHATALHQLQRREQAIASLDRVVALRPDHAISWNNRANMLLESGRPSEALQSYDRAIVLDADYAEAWHNRAVARIQMRNYSAAEADLDRALQLKPDYADALEHRGLLLALQGRHQEALPSYDAALELQPSNVEALISRGGLLATLQRHADALADFDRAISLKRNNAAAWRGRATALAQLNHDGDAIESFTEVLRITPRDCVALYNRASLYSRLERYEEAIRDAVSLLGIDPDYPLARGLSMHARLHICDWRSLAEARQQIEAALGAGKRAIYPFGLLAFSDSLAEQLQCARLAAREASSAAPAPLIRRASYRHERIRIAYLSGDFYTHAIPFLIAGVFEHHDREHFETFGIAYGPNDKSEMRARLEKAFTQFIDARDATDTAIAATLREREADIVVDLKGYTGGARHGILACRPAPVQVHYLGYPGTMGADYVDYLIADRTVIPEEHRQFYTEQIVYLPDMYQCNDSRRRIGERAVDRTAAGLPEKGFVFCCFNGNHKILPETFRSWMSILSKVKGSVLWLLEGHPSAAANLRREAEANGVAAERLIFAKRMALEDHLSRLNLADLVLDTLPYGAHTTASDALWAGVPVLTRIGTTFAGRVAASLLGAIGLPELVTHSSAQYESLACDLAQDGSRLAAMKTKLARNRDTMPLFDTAKITRNLEAAYSEMWARHQRGESPASFAVT